jgi:hypothetical protein
MTLKEWEIQYQQIMNDREKAYVEVARQNEKLDKHLERREVKSNGVFIDGKWAYSLE